MIDTNTKRNEHPSCGCFMCSRGLRSKAGHAQQAAVNRRLRRKAKQALNRAAPDQDVEPIIEPTGYTD